MAYARSREVAMRLPRDAEWEYVARKRGGDHRFPWGSEFEAGLLASAPRVPGSTAGDRTPGDDPVFDLGGNVSEWVEMMPKDGPMVVTARGASWLYPSERMAHAGHRLRPDRSYRGPQLGLRLAKAAQ